MFFIRASGRWTIANQDSPARHRNLRAFRRARKLNQRAAAALVDISQAEWCRIERGSRIPRRPLAERIAERTGVPLLTILKIKEAILIAVWLGGT